MKFILQTRGYGKTYYERERRKKKMNEEVRLILNKGYRESLSVDDIKIIIDYIEEIESENIVLKDNNRNMQDEMIRTWEKIDKVMKNNYSEIKHYKFLRDIKDIIKDREVGYMETCDILESVINKELDKYE